MEKKSDNHTQHIASIDPNPKPGRQQIRWHISPESPSAKRAKIIAAPQNNRSYEEQSSFIKR